VIASPTARSGVRLASRTQGPAAPGTNRSHTSDPSSSNALRLRPESRTAYGEGRGDRKRIRYGDSGYRYDRCSTCRSGFSVRDSNGHERRAAHGGLALDGHTRKDAPNERLTLMRVRYGVRSTRQRGWRVVRSGPYPASDPRAPQRPGVAPI
jgi:hypothetical protein